MWLNEKHTEEGLHHKNVRAATLKYLSNYIKYRDELADKLKNQPNIIFIGKKLAIKVNRIVEQHQHINLEKN